MTSNKLFIPTRIKVGFQNRSDTFTQKLAYVIYYDTKGKLRKEDSWEGWRDKTIEPVEYDNEPRSGFILNKDVQRYGWHYYSSGRSMIRIYDDRGIEFEITPANLLFILMNTNCHKRELEGEFVYAWDGKDLVLLPTCSEEYKASMGHTQLQACKVSAKTLKGGCTYKDKKGVDFVYIGRMRWRRSPQRSWSTYLYENLHVFAAADSISNDEPRFEAKEVATLAQVVSEDVVENYAELVTAAQASKYHQLPCKLSVIPLPEKVSEEEAPSIRTYGHTQKTYYKVISDTEVHQFIEHHNYGYSSSRTSIYPSRIIKIEPVKTSVKFSRDYCSDRQTVQLTNLQEGKLQVHLENGQIVDYDQF